MGGEVVQNPVLDRDSSNLYCCNRESPRTMELGHRKNRNEAKGIRDKKNDGRMSTSILKSDIFYSSRSPMGRFRDASPPHATIDNNHTEEINRHSTPI